MYTCQLIIHLSQMINYIRNVRGGEKRSWSYVGRRKGGAVLGGEEEGAGPEICRGGGGCCTEGVEEQELSVSSTSAAVSTVLDVDSTLFLYMQCLRV